MSAAFDRRSFFARTGIVIAGAGLLSSVSACAGEETQPVVSNPNQLENASGSVNYWAGMQGSQREAFEKYLGAFSTAHPKVDIKVSYKTLDSLDQQIQTALAAGGGPDLVPTPGPSSIGGYVTADLLMPLDAYAEAGKWESKLLPWALGSAKIDNKIYALPTSFETIFILFNKTLFDKMGYQKPTNRAEFEALCTDIAASGKKPFTSGNAEFQGVNIWWMTLAFNHVAGPEATYEALTGKRPWTDPVFVESTNLIKDYFQRGWIGGGVKQYFTTQFGTIYDEFSTGEAAMYMSGSWEFPSLNEPFEKSGQEYDWMPIPALGPEAGYPVFDIGIGSTLSISAKSKNPDAAAVFLDWQLSDPKAMLEFVAETDGIPMPVPFEVEDLPEGFNPKEASQYAALIEATSKGNFGYTIWTFWSSKSQDYLLRNFSGVIADKMSVEEYLQGYDAIFQKDLKAGLVPPALPRIG